MTRPTLGQSTPNLIDGLVSDLRPTPPAALQRRLAMGLGGGLLVGLVLVVAVLGIRPDLGAAVHGTSLWVKTVYVALLATGGVWATARLAQPGRTTGRGAVVVIGLAVLTIAGLALRQYVPAPDEMRAPLLMGSSAARCPWLIALLGVPVMAGVMWALRGLAPTRLRLAGGVAGLAGGAAGACAYCLHCPETAMPFVAVWYTAGIALVGMLGALLGPRLLRW